MMIVKFFEIASDVRYIKNNLHIKESDNNSIKISHFEESSISGEFKFEETNITYSKNGNNIVFSDGTSGEIKTYPGYPECSIITEDKFELLYNNEDYAILALYQYLKYKTESQQGLFTKRKYNK